MRENSWVHSMLDGPLAEPGRAPAESLKQTRGLTWDYVCELETERAVLLADRRRMRTLINRYQQLQVHLASGGAADERVYTRADVQMLVAICRAGDAKARVLSRTDSHQELSDGCSSETSEAGASGRQDDQGTEAPPGAEQKDTG